MPVTPRIMSNGLENDLTYFTSNKEAAVVTSGTAAIQLPLPLLNTVIMEKYWGQEVLGPPSNSDEIVFHDLQ